MARYTAQDLETRFKGIASSRISQKKSGDSRYFGDAGYWDGGRCDYGGAHNLKEDCQRLSAFFSEITELRNIRQKLINFNNQQEFENNKKNLLNKTDKSLNGLNMKTGAATSIGGVCIIWSDFTHFFGPIVDNFRKELEILRKNIENVPYNEAKELQKLLIEERALQNEITENERKARNEPDKDKAKKFIFLADQAKEQWKKLLERKKGLKSSRLGDDFNPDNHIDNFLQQLEKKLTPRDKQPRLTRIPNQPSQSPNNNDEYTGFGDIPLNNPYPNSPNNNQQKPFLGKYWKELLLGGIFLLGFYYLYNQPE